MAEAFLRQLLQVHNRVESDEEQKCIICHEECGKMNQETGLLELAINLPCKHIVGSGCIAQWLRTNNTCPLCRQVFFPAQPRSYLENGFMEGQTTLFQINRAQTVGRPVLTGSISDPTYYLRQMKRRIDDYCTQLSLQPGTAQVALYLLANLQGMGPFDAIIRTDHHGNDCVVAVSIYIASHLTGHPRYAREISAVVDDVDDGHRIRATYHLLRDPSAIIDDGILYELSEVFNIEALAWPPHGNDLTAVETALEAFTALCSQYCVVLDLPASVTTMAARVGSRVWNIAPLHQAFRYPGSLPAACVYMAVYLMGFFQPLNRIAQAARETEDDVVKVYRLLYSERRLIFQPSWLRFIGRYNMETALAMLPVL